MIKSLCSYYKIILNQAETNPRRKRATIFENSVCSTEDLFDYKRATELGLMCYITAQINGALITNDGLTVNLGDDEDYGGYYNAPLVPDTEYGLVLGVTVDFQVQKELNVV